MGMFNPEVRTIEGSNVGTYNPPTVDYSGVLGNIGASIGNAITDLSRSGRGGSGDSATEKKMAALQDYTRNLVKSEGIEDKTKKAVFQKAIYLNAVQEYPLYQDEFNKLRATFNGETYTATGSDPIELAQGNIKTWASSDPEGQRITALAMIKTGGDPIKMDGYIAEGYYQDQAHKASMRRMKEESEGIDLSKKQKEYIIEKEFRPMLAKKYDAMFDQDLSSEAVKQAYSKAIAEGVDENTYLIDALQYAYETRLQQFNLEVNTYGVDPTQLKGEVFLQKYTTAINNLKANKDAFSRALQGETVEQRAELASKFFQGNPIGQAILMGGNVSPEVQIEWLRNPNNRDELTRAMQHKVGVAGSGSAPMVAGVTDADMTQTDSPTATADIWTNFANREEIIKIASAPSEVQDSIVTLGTKNLSGYKFNPNLPEGVENAYKNIGSLFITTLPQIDKDRSSTKSSIVSQLLSDSTFATFEEIGKGNAMHKADLYNKAAQYSINTIRTVEGMFSAQMKNLETYPNYPPFILSSDKNGVVSLQVNPEAVKFDPNLKKAMGMYRYSGGRGGLMTQEIPATIVDPQKILDNYTALVRVGGTFPFEGNTGKEIRDYVKTLNIISRQSNRIPTDIRNRGADPLQIIRSITVSSE
jgi:hypothetical protein